MPLISNKFDSLGRLADGAIDHTRTYRLGIMGGTFDPIHIGHLAVAEQAREACGLDAVLFIPAANPVFKRGQHVTAAEDRLAMCRLACADNKFFDVSPIEIDRGGDTYTVDTLRELRGFYPSNVDLYFIMGGDAALSLSKWRNVDDMADLAQFVATARPGYHAPGAFAQVQAEHPALQVHFVNVVALDVSSSMLRDWVGRGRSIRYLTPLAVCRYIQSKGLYRKKEQ